MKWLLFQVHWLLGITAGLVLAVVGITGAMLSFEDDLLKALNPGVMTVAPAGRVVLPLPQLWQRIAAAEPGRRVQALTVSSDATDAARVQFAAAPGAAAGPRGPRGESRFVDPYSGELLPPPRAEGFFRTTMQVHRWLAAGDVGKHVVGASTVALVYFCLSGLYLRWPRRARDWRAWLLLHWSRRGRPFLWGLHSVLGTWVLLVCLLMALSGLFWSYGWYRDGLYALTGATPRQRGPAAASVPTDAGADLPLLWERFTTHVPAFSSATLNLTGATAQVRYLDADPRHERAANTLSFGADGALLGHDRYDGQPFGERLMRSIFPLHSGSYFGTAGVLAYMLGSLAMPVFAVTGWMLYLDRRRRREPVRKRGMVATPGLSSAPAVSGAPESSSAPVPSIAGPAWLVAFATQSGSAETLAQRSAALLADGGLQVELRALGKLDAATLQRASHVLIVASTFGDGEAPDMAHAFCRQVMSRQLPLQHLRYGLLALGDSSYDLFCGFGRSLEDWLHACGAQPLFDTVLADDGDPAALRHWQHQLGVLCDRTDVPDWSPPRLQRWRLLERATLNPGSPGAPCFRVRLAPCAGELPAWQAGDIAEVGLEDPQSLLEHAPRLPSREYSIASMPQDGCVELLVREMRRADGSLGLGSAWLGHQVALGGEVALRIRPNPNFRVAANGAPLLLIGNGTGMAALHAHLRQAEVRGVHGHWLLFGERSSAHDFHLGADIREWQRSGVLARVDLAFSRDGAGRVYVQHLLAAAAGPLRAFVAGGATILVSGSLAGMAPAVDAVLREALGSDAVDALAQQGRYRRDVY